MVCPSSITNIEQMHVLMNAADEILWDLVGSRENEIALAFDHVNKSRSFWGKTDSIFIR
jgi:hypothetical protein